MITQRAYQPQPVPTHIRSVQLRLPLGILPTKVDGAGFVNGMRALLQGSILRPGGCTIFCHGRGEIPLGQLHADKVIAATLPIARYGEHLAREEAGNTSLFYCREFPVVSPEIEHYGRFLWQADPTISRETETWLDQLASEAPHAYSHGTFWATPIILGTSAGEFASLDLAKSHRSLLAAQVSKAKAGEEPSGDLPMAGWGLYGYLPLDGKDSSQGKILRGVELELSLRSLSLTSIAVLCAGLFHWLDHELSHEGEALGRIDLSAPTLPLLGAFSSELCKRQPNWRNKIFLPDWSHGWSPLQNYLSLWAQPEESRLLISLGDFPRVSCFLLTDEGLLRGH